MTTIELIPIYRVSTFVPLDAVEAVRSSILSFLPPLFGNYSGVIWTSGPGEERFIPNELSRPSRGKVHQSEKVAAAEIIFSVPRDSLVLKVLLEKAILPVHPWEEPVVFVEEVFAVRKQP